MLVVKLNDAGLPLRNTFEFETYVTADIAWLRKNMNKPAIRTKRTKNLTSKRNLQYNCALLHKKHLKFVKYIVIIYDYTQIFKFYIKKPLKTFI